MDYILSIIIERKIWLSIHSRPENNIRLLIYCFEPKATLSAQHPMQMYNAIGASIPIRNINPPKSVQMNEALINDELKSFPLLYLLWLWNIIKLHLFGIAPYSRKITFHK